MQAYNLQTADLMAALALVSKRQKIQTKTKSQELLVVTQDSFKAFCEAKNVTFVTEESDILLLQESVMLSPKFRKVFMVKLLEITCNEIANKLLD